MRRNWMELTIKQICTELDVIIRAYAIFLAWWGFFGPYFANNAASKAPTSAAAFLKNIKDKILRLQIGGAMAPTIELNPSLRAQTISWCGGKIMCRWVTHQREEVWLLLFYIWTNQAVNAFTYQLWNQQHKLQHTLWVDDLAGVLTGLRKSQVLPS